jgi:hypothetical protein
MIYIDDAGEFSARVRYTVALYSCISANNGQFLNKDPSCEGKGAGPLLGYALP